MGLPPILYINLYQEQSTIEMRVSFPTALAAFATGTSAAGTLGFALGVKRPDGSCKVTGDYEADFDAIKSSSGSTDVRVFDASECDVVAQILPAAQTKGFGVVLGVWPDTDGQYNAGKAAIVNTAVNFKDQVVAVTVGSEGLYRGTYTADFLVGKLNDIRAAAPDFKYGTGDTWNRWADGTADPILQVSDIALVNAFSYWQGASIEAAPGVFQDSIGQAFNRINSVKPGIPLWVGETGWPSRGTTYQNAVPTVENAETYYRQAVCGSLGSGTNVFVFEAFDEPWKPQSIGEDGSSADETSWGVMTADRQPKYNIMC